MSSKATGECEDFNHSKTETHRGSTQDRFTEPDSSYQQTNTQNNTDCTVEECWDHHSLRWVLKAHYQYCQYWMTVQSICFMYILQEWERPVNVCEMAADVLWSAFLWTLRGLLCTWRFFWVNFSIYILYINTTLLPELLRYYYCLFLSTGQPILHYKHYREDTAWRHSS